MRLFANIRHSLPLAGGIAAVLSAACSGDAPGGEVDGAPPPPPLEDGGGNADPDAGGPEPDAAPEAGTLRGSVALTDVDVTNPAADDVFGGLTGSRADISFVESADEPAFDDGTCTVYSYDLAGGDSPPEGLDAGSVSISGTNLGTAAEGAFDCEFVGGEYRCTIDEGQDLTITADRRGDDLTDIERGEIELVGVDLNDPALNIAGGELTLDGFVDEDAEDDVDESDLNATYRIDAKDDADLVSVAFHVDDVPLLEGVEQSPGFADYETPEDAGSYAIAVTGRLVPNEFQDISFLDAGAEVSVQKDAANDTPAIDATLTSAGDGLQVADGELDGTTYLAPHAFPATADEAASFGCNPTGEDGNCGVTTDDGENVFIVRGRTTDADIPDAAHFFEMPEGQDSVATFECVSRDPDREGSAAVTIPTDALTAILGTEPTRIETQVIYAAEEAIEDGDALTRVRAGHGRVGYTDIAAEQ